MSIDFSVGNYYEYWRWAAAAAAAKNDKNGETQNKVFIVQTWLRSNYIIAFVCIVRSRDIRSTNAESNNFAHQ